MPNNYYKQFKPKPFVKLKPTVENNQVVFNTIKGIPQIEKVHLDFYIFKHPIVVFVSI